MSQLRFIKITQPEDAARIISTELNKMLATKVKVLLLLAGGSAVPLAVRLRQKLDIGHNLTISLSDERYGPVGHTDSNWAQLEAAGFDFSGIEAHPVLKGESLEQSAVDFDHFLKNASSEFDWIAALLGMGPDGHTSGILPGSGLSTSTLYASSYQAEDYQRITTTPLFLSRLDQAFVYAVGEAKHSAIDDLDREIGLEEQPVQIIKSIDKVMFFNDYKGE